MRAVHVVCAALLAAIAPSAIALTPPPDTTITALSNLGQPVMGAPAGDVDGDGFEDLIFGSMAFEDGEFFEGALFLYYGGPGGIASGGLDSGGYHDPEQPGPDGARGKRSGSGRPRRRRLRRRACDRPPAPPTNDARVHVYHGSATGIVTTATTTLTTLQDNSLFGFYARQLATVAT